MTTTRRRVIVGTRRSPLSRAQTDEVLALIQARWPSVEFVVTPLSTSGDANKDAPLLSMRRGMFVKDIERALLDQQVDLAVHSSKDMPADIPEGLAIAAFTQRQDPRDVLVSKSGLPLMKLPDGVRIGTSSPRRQALIGSLRPDIQVVPIRGNVGTRLEKARSEDYDAVVLAAAGLIRLGRQDEVTEYLSPDVFTPDTGQGALALEVRESDAELVDMLSAVDHWQTSTAVRAERAFLAAIGGGCKVPVAAYARFESADLRVSALAAIPDGTQVFRTEMRGDPRDPEGLGRSVTEALIATGAGEILTRGDYL